MIEAGVALPLVGISIVHWNGGDATLACIESVLADDYRPLRIFLIDNGSTDGVAAIVAQRWPAIVVVRNGRNTGFTGGHNRGIALALEAGAAHVLLLNQDALVVPGCLRRLVDLMESDARTGLVSPMVAYADQPARAQFRGSWLDRARMTVVYDGDLETAMAHDRDPAVTMCLWGTALLIRRAVVERIGVLDDRLFAYYEDTDYSVRAAAAGWRNRMCFEARILHDGHPTRYSRAPHFFYFMYRNQMLFWRKVLPLRCFLRLRRICVARTLREAAMLRDAGMDRQVDACMSGLWDAFVAHHGAYDPARRAPRWLSELLLRHPFFVSDLLEGHFGALVPRRAQKPGA